MNNSKQKSSSIYIDTYELIKKVHSAIYDFPKKDRVVLGDRIMNTTLSMMSNFGLAYKITDKRLEYIDLFLADFEVAKVLLRIATDLKYLKPAKQVEIFSYIQRIDEGVMKWRKSVISKNQASKVSNYDLGSDKQKTRGGDGFI